MSRPHTNDQQPLSTADMAAAAEARTPQPDVRTTTAREPAAAVPATPRPAAAARTAEAAGTRPSALLAADQGDAFQARWNEIQTGFVDEPRRAVEQADALVAEVMKHLAGTFAKERSQLEAQWARGDQVSTEDLRVALQRYRSFFDRLLSV